MQCQYFSYFQPPYWIAQDALNVSFSCYLHHFSSKLLHTRLCTPLGPQQNTHQVWSRSDERLSGKKQHHVWLLFVGVKCLPPYGRCQGPRVNECSASVYAGTYSRSRTAKCFLLMISWTFESKLHTQHCTALSSMIHPLLKVWGRLDEWFLRYDSQNIKTRADRDSWL